MFSYLEIVFKTVFFDMKMMYSSILYQLDIFTGFFMNHYCFNFSDFHLPKFSLFFKFSSCPKDVLKKMVLLDLVYNLVKKESPKEVFFC